MPQNPMKTKSLRERKQGEISLDGTENYMKAIIIKS